MTFLAGVAVLWSGLASAQGTTRWTRFVTVEGQPEPIPEQWVSTPEGRFAHSIKLPNSVPKDSGYRPEMTSKEYFAHLCKTEAGEFIFRTVENVEGILFMRPPKVPTDAQLMDRYGVEDPDTEPLFQLMVPDPRVRAALFVNPPWNTYRFAEEPVPSANWKSEIHEPYVRMEGYVQGQALMKLRGVPHPSSQYGYVWRGLKRPNDRERGIAGSELIVMDLMTKEVLAVRRNFVLTGSTRNTESGISWLVPESCPDMPRYGRGTLIGRQLYGFVAKVAKPIAFDAVDKRAQPLERP